MSPPRKAPHCRTCHKALKGHKRGVCDTTNTSPTESPHDTLPNSEKHRSGPRKSAPLPLDTLSTLSPQSSEILNNLLRTNSHSAPPPVQVPLQAPPRLGKRTLRSTTAARHDDEPLDVALSRLSASDEKKNKLAEDTYAPTEIEETETVNVEPEGVQHASAPAVPRHVRFQSLIEVVTLSPQVTSSEVVSQELQLQASASDLAPTDMTIQNFLDSMAQSSHHPPATIFSFPAEEVPSLQEGAHRLGLTVHVLPLFSANQDWVPVIVGRNIGAVAKLLRDGEKLANKVQSEGSSPNEFALGMSHIVAGTLGVLATWAGLAYT